MAEEGMECWAQGLWAHEHGQGCPEPVWNWEPLLRPWGILQKLSRTRSFRIDYPCSEEWTFSTLWSACSRHGSKRKEKKNILSSHPNLCSSRTVFLLSFLRAKVHEILPWGPFGYFLAIILGFFTQ